MPADPSPITHHSSRPIGLIAGGGRLPLLEARGVRARGRQVACVGLAGQFDTTLPGHCDFFATAGIAHLGRWARLLRRWNVREAILVGYVGKTRMYDPLKFLRIAPDWRAARVWYRVLRHDRRSQAMLSAVADDLDISGIELIDTTRYIPDQLSDQGVMTRRSPSGRHEADIAFGWSILMRMTDLDIGQAIAVKDRDVIAVEAMEGTDAMIRRAGELCQNGNWTLLKGPGPSKDMRFDVPTVGTQTIESLKRSGSTCLAVAAGRVILADKPRVIATADKAGIAMVGV